MPYKTKEQRKEHYKKNKEEINKKRREYSKRPEVHKRKLKIDSIWRENNREKANRLSNRAKKKYEKNCKRLVFEHYGEVCACCGESIKEFLTIDHINGGGTKHRKKDGRKICVWLFKNNFPKGFQTLCFNCNWGKHINGGICPHKQKNSITTL